MLRHLKGWQHRRPGHILPFRIPFFRIFYSTTYTTLFLLDLVILAITPASLLYTAIRAEAFQYVFMIGGVYVLTAILAIFIYSSRLYTNRSVLAGVGKAYVPVEDGEIGRKVRKMIVAQLERSAVVAWEARPRDVAGEILRAEKEGLLPYEEPVAPDRDGWTVGRIISVDPAYPPWGDVQHPGWSAPAQARGEVLWNLQFEVVVKELPNLIEARAVSLAPLYSNSEAAFFDEAEQVVADPVVVDTLRRPARMGMREYLTQLSYLGLVNPPSTGQEFLGLYEKARFSGRPSPESEFNELMTTFAQLLEGMTTLSPDIVAEIRALSESDTSSSRTDSTSLAPSDTAGSVLQYATHDPPRSATSSIASPVTAKTRLWKANSPYLQHEGGESDSSSASVLRQYPRAEVSTAMPKEPPAPQSGLGLGYGTPKPKSASLRSIRSDVGSVLHHDIKDGNG